MVLVDASGWPSTRVRHEDDDGNLLAGSHSSVREKQIPTVADVHRCSGNNNNRSASNSTGSSDDDGDGDQHDDDGDVDDDADDARRSSSLLSRPVRVHAASNTNE